jgi:hypothetical protein
MNTRFINTVRRGLVVAVAILAVQATAVLSPASARAGVQSGLEKFAADVVINSAFDKVLHRSPDDSEQRRYRVRIFEDHWGGSDIEEDLRGRRDYRTYNDRRDSGPSSGGDADVDRMIQHAYEDILGRRPDPEGLRTYRSNVIDRGWTERQVRDALRKSPEYRRETSNTADSIVRHAYREVLGREPDSAGLREYRNRIEEHGWDEHDVAVALRNSPEYREKNSISDAEARAIVRRAYQSVLGREPDPGAEGFVTRVRRDHWTERDVARELRNSDEYRNKGR